MVIIKKYILPLLGIILLLIPCLAFGQAWKSKPFSIAIINNATLLPPESLIAPFKGPLHPGIALTYEFGWKETIKNPVFQNVDTYALGGRRVFTGKWFQNIGLSWYNHKYVNHAFVLSTQAGYRLYIKKFSAEVSIHAGFMEAMLYTEKFKRKDGMWKATFNPGRAYFIGGAGIGLGYDAGFKYNTRRLFINYDFRVQTPFVKSYVPVLPNGILSLGIQFTLFRNNKKSDNQTPTRLACPES